MSEVPNSTFDLKYSIDSGDNWVTVESGASISSGSENVWTQHRYPFDANSRRIRFKLSQDSDTDIQIRSAHIKFDVLEDR